MQNRWREIKSLNIYGDTVSGSPIHHQVSYSSPLGIVESSRAVSQPQHAGSFHGQEHEASIIGRGSGSEARIDDAAEASSCYEIDILTKGSSGWRFDVLQG